MGRRTKVTEMSAELKQFIAEVTARRANLEMSQADLAYKTKLGDGWIRRFEKGEELNPTVDTLCRICEALKLNFVLAVAPKAGSWDDTITGVYTRRVLAQLVPTG